MAAHKHEYSTLHEVYPEPLEEADADAVAGDLLADGRRMGEVGTEHDKPYRVEFCAAPDCPEQKRIVELTADEAERLGIRIGRIVSDDLRIISENASGGA